MFNHSLESSSVEFGWSIEIQVPLLRKCVLLDALMPTVLCAARQTRSGL